MVTKEGSDDDQDDKIMTSVFNAIRSLGFSSRLLIGDTDVNAINVERERDFPLSENIHSHSDEGLSQYLPRSSTDDAVLDGSSQVLF